MAERSSKRRDGESRKDGKVRNRVISIGAAAGAFLTFGVSPLLGAPVAKADGEEFDFVQQIVDALTAVDPGQSLELRQEPLLCTGCELCIAHCPAACLSIEETGPALGQTLCLQEYPCCNECGKPFKPAGQQLTCFDCLLKGRESIFGP